MIGGLLPLPTLKDLDVPEPTSCCRALCADGPYCHNCDLLVGLDGYHVLDVARGPDGLTPSPTFSSTRKVPRGSSSPSSRS